jgi:DNA invertase Pin-like site-specific DNA recombinase
MGQCSPSARAVAYFRSSSQVDHGHAISIQQDQVHQWANKRGIEIIHEFCDIGPSGTDAQELPALTEMIDDWIKPRSDFELVLCVDASRLGRYSDSNYAKSAIAAFELYKKQLIFTSMGKQPSRSIETA